MGMELLQVKLYFLIYAATLCLTLAATTRAGVGREAILTTVQDLRMGEDLQFIHPFRKSEMPQPPPSLHRKEYHETPTIGIYKLKKGNFSLKLTNKGATIVSLIVPDKNGSWLKFLGYDIVNEYKNDTSYIGAIVGRVANSIKGAQFALNGIVYNISANEGTTLHGSPLSMLINNARVSISKTK